MTTYRCVSWGTSPPCIQMHKHTSTNSFQKARTSTIWVDSDVSKMASSVGDLTQQSQGHPVLIAPPLAAATSVEVTMN